MLLHLLEEARKERRFAALVDGANAFDPQTAPPALIEHLLWVRCRSVEQALRAADVLLRDENLGMVIVDLRDWRWVGFEADAFDGLVSVTAVGGPMGGDPSRFHTASDDPERPD